MIRVIILTLLLISTSVNFLSAEEYFLTLHFNNVNLRQGPSFDYPIKIFYTKKLGQIRLAKFLVKNKEFF